MEAGASKALLNSESRGDSGIGWHRDDTSDCSNGRSSRMVVGEQPASIPTHEWSKHLKSQRMVSMLEQPSEALLLVLGQKYLAQPKKQVMITQEHMRKQNYHQLKVLSTLEHVLCVCVETSAEISVRACAYGTVPEIPVMVVFFCVNNFFLLINVTGLMKARRAQQHEDEEEDEQSRNNPRNNLVIEGEAMDLSGGSFDMGDDEHVNDRIRSALIESSTLSQVWSCTYCFTCTPTLSLYSR